MSTITCQFSCWWGFAHKGQDVSRASATGIVRSVHYTGRQLQNGQLSIALGSCVYSHAADPLIQLRFTTLAKAESLTCAGERGWGGTFGSDVMHSWITEKAKLLCTWGGEGVQYLIWYWRSRHLKAIIRTLIIHSFVTICKSFLACDHMQRLSPYNHWRWVCKA